MKLKSQLLTIFLAFMLLQECRISHSKAISGKMSDLEKELADMVGKFDVDDADKPQTYNDKSQTYNDKAQTYNDKPQTYKDKKSQTYNDKPQTYNDKSQTYNDKPQTYNDLIKEIQTYSDDKSQTYEDMKKDPQTYSHDDKPQTYNDKPQTYNDKPQTYDDKPQTYKDKKRNHIGLLKQDEALMKSVIEASKQEKKSLEGFVPPEDDKTSKDIKADLSEFTKDLSPAHKREHSNSWGKGKVEVPDKLPAPPEPKGDNKEKRTDAVMAAIVKKLREMRKRGMKLSRSMVEKLTEYAARKRSETVKPQTYNDKPQTYDDKPQTYDDKPQTYNDKPQTYNHDSVPPREPGERPHWPEAPSDAKVEDLLMTRLANKLEDMSQKGREIPDKMVDILGKYLRKRRLNKRISKGH